MPKSLLTTAKDLPSTKDLRHHRVHAIVGLYVVLHFVYRYVMFFVDIESDMGFAYHLEKLKPRSSSSMILLFFVPHVLAQISGFGFKIPSTRHPDGNRIWPQYRFEAVIFFGRSMALLSLAWYNKQIAYLHGHKEKFDLESLPCAVAFGIVLATMVAADMVTKRFVALGQSSRTIRGLKAPPFVQYLMSATQFHATLHSLMTNKNLCVQIAALSVVQLSAFGMTLRRKGIISQSRGVLLYATILVLGMVVIVHDLTSRGTYTLYFAIALGNIAALLRFECGWNKYILWCTMAAVVRYTFVSSSGQHFIVCQGTEKIWFNASMCSTFLLLLEATKRQMASINGFQQKVD